MKSIIILCALLLSASTHAQLIDRGSGLIYDSDLDATWLMDANYAMTSGYDSDGLMTKQESIDWASQLQYAGFSNWSLPTVFDQNPSGCVAVLFSGGDCGFNVDTSTGEMAHLFYDELGNIAFFDVNGNGPQTGYGLSNTSYFNNLESYVYWAVPDQNTITAWTFNFENGNQAVHNDGDEFYALAIHNGDIGAVVPVPAAIWLFSSGLVLFFGYVARRKHSIVNLEG